ncbi:nuclear transport factor 2 family protein [Streptomyces tsukubensis]|uniref:nuclear transport factor 2 family protein n=1 Tax=Streptomyces tsukubensis TaxID=83656 RepID=UPI00344BB5E1
MEDSVEGVVAAHLAAWNAPAGAGRDGLIAKVYSPGVFIGEPGAAHRGHDGMNAAVSGLQEQLPGTVITRSGPIQQAQDLVTYSWTLGPADGPAAASGRDVLLLADGRITSLYVLIDTA